MDNGDSLLAYLTWAGAVTVNGIKLPPDNVKLG